MCSCSKFFQRVQSRLLSSLETRPLNFCFWKNRLQSPHVLQPSGFTTLHDLRGDPEESLNSYRIYRRLRRSRLIARWMEVQISILRHLKMQVTSPTDGRTDGPIYRHWSESEMRWCILMATSRLDKWLTIDKWLSWCCSNRSFALEFSNHCPTPPLSITILQPLPNPIIIKDTVFKCATFCARIALVRDSDCPPLPWSKDRPKKYI